MPRESTPGPRPLTQKELYEFLMEHGPKMDWLDARDLVRETNGGQIPDFYDEVLDQAIADQKFNEAKKLIGATLGDAMRRRLLEIYQNPKHTLKGVVARQQHILGELTNEQINQLLEHYGQALKDTEKR